MKSSEKDKRIEREDIGMYILIAGIAIMLLLQCLSWCYSRFTGCVCENKSSCPEDIG